MRCCSATTSTLGLQGSREAISPLRASPGRPTIRTTCLKGKSYVDLCFFFRVQYYTEVLSHDPGDLFDVSYGLLLERSLHHAFDRGEWGLYPDPLVSILFRRRSLACVS